MSRLVNKTAPKGPHIEITTSTWTKDSHGLYDYQAQEQSYRKQTFYVKSGIKISRDINNQQTVFNVSSKLEESLFPMVAEIVVDKTKAVPEYKLKWSNKKQQENQKEQQNNQYRTYLVVRDYSKDGVNMGYSLKPGNVIKLGRVEYMVIESKNEEETFTLRDTNHFGEINGVFEISKNRVEHDKAMQEGEKNCKVCLCSEQTENDPLISPCKCKGSCRLIHVGCLKTWINSKVKKQFKSIASSYNFTKFECQICKFPFPQIIRFDTKDVEMMTITKPNKPYILLQSLCNKQQNKQERCLHLISTEENTPIKIGRGHECQIRITDISVSRKHAEINLKDGQFYITDTKAKFGTLIKLEQDFIMSPGKSIKIQCGRTLFDFKLKAEPLQDVDTE